MNLLQGLEEHDGISPSSSSMFLISPLRVFIMAALKFLSDNSNIFVILVLESVDCLFSIQFEIFLVLGMMSDF